MKKKILENEIGHLKERGEAAYAQQNDELLIKFVNCICKAFETQDKLDPPEQESIELILKDEPKPGKTESKQERKPRKKAQNAEDHA